MFYVTLAVLILLLAWSTYSFMYSRREVWQRREVFYSQIIECVDGATVKDNGSFFPTLEGFFENYRIRVVPVIDTLSMRSLPKLYVMISVLLKNSFRCRILAGQDRSYIFSPADFEHVCLFPDEKRPFIKMFMAQAPAKKEYSQIIEVLDKLVACSEIMIGENFVCGTFLAAKADKSYYRVMRAAVFPGVKLNRHSFTENVRLLVNLCEEVTKLEAV